MASSQRPFVALSARADSAIGPHDSYSKQLKPTPGPFHSFLYLGDEKRDLKTGDSAAAPAGLDMHLHDRREYEIVDPTLYFKDPLRPFQSAEFERAAKNFYHPHPRYL